MKRQMELRKVSKYSGRRGSSTNVDYDPTMPASDAPRGHSYTDQHHERPGRYGTAGRDWGHDSGVELERNTYETVDRGRRVGGTASVDTYDRQKYFPSAAFEVKRENELSVSTRSAPAKEGILVVLADEEDTLDTPSSARTVPITRTRIISVRSNAYSFLFRLTISIYTKPFRSILLHILLSTPSTFPIKSNLQ
ncbi:hypothetical protein HDV00_010961 [Rhizophlyctis rosea]|nr:hypothetical protein HDV00_010961 [Rhizophlyctis rosea]